MSKEKAKLNYLLCWRAKMYKQIQSEESQENNNKK